MGGGTNVNERGYTHVQSYRKAMFFLVEHILLLECAKSVRHKSSKVIKSSPVYNMLQHYLLLLIRIKIIQALD